MTSSFTFIFFIRWWSWLSPNGPSETKVTDLDRAVLIDEDVSWLQVSMQNLWVVQVFNTKKQVVHYFLNMIEFKVQRAFNKFFDVTLHIFHDYVQGLEAFNIAWLEYL